MSDDGSYLVQLTVKGTDAHGCEAMWNIRGKTTEEFDAEYAKRLPAMNALKPLPVRSFGPGKPRKEIKHLDGSPDCPEHNTPMDPREWKGDRGTMYFWSCNGKTNGQYCKARIDARPTQEQYRAWCVLNEIAIEGEMQATKPTTAPQAQQPAAKPTGRQVGNPLIPTGPITSPMQLLAEIRKVTDYYTDADQTKSFFHLHGAIQKHTGVKNWNWPKASDTEGWKAAFDSAIYYAREQVLLEKDAAKAAAQ